MRGDGDPVDGACPVTPSARRPYRAPRLEWLGDIRGLTLGTSPGVPDSGVGGGEFNLNP